jgi:hypothetical protein
VATVTRHVLLATVTCHVLLATVTYHVLLATVTYHVLLARVTCHVLLATVTCHVLLARVTCHVLLACCNAASCRSFSMLTLLSSVAIVACCASHAYKNTPGRSRHDHNLKKEP